MNNTLEELFFKQENAFEKIAHISNDSVVASTITLTRKYDKKNVIIGGVPGHIIKREINWDYFR